MMIQYFHFIYLFMSFLLPMCSAGTDSTPTYGPYKTSLTSINDCTNPSRPYMKNPPMTYHPFFENVNGKSMLGGNFTVVKDCRDVRMKMKSFSWRNGTWRHTHSFNNLDCHGYLLHFTFAFAGVKYDKKNCMFFKGFYVFNMDVNQLHHIWVPASPYGRVLFRMESYTNAGMFICKEFESLTEPGF